VVLTYPELRELASQSEKAVYEAGDLLFVQEEPGEDFFLIRRGTVEILAPTLLAVRERGELIGEMALVDSGRRSATARARTRVEVRRLGPAVINHLFLQHPELVRQLMRLIVGRLRTSQANLIAQVQRYRELASPQAGGVLGHYEVLGRLGKGGMGSVYRARSLVDGGIVALKVVETGESSRLLRERELLARLSHPHIVRVLDGGQHQGWLYLAMECIEGETLQGYVGSPWSVVKPLFAALCEALAFAHEHGVAHRDLKPANVMVDRAGVLKLVDFGLGQAGELERLTRTGRMVGTPTYFPPERLRGEDEGPAGDQYSLGVLLFELLAGRPPFVGEEAAHIFAQHLRSRPPDLRDLCAVPSEVAAAVRRMLAKNPHERFASVRAVLEAVDVGETSEQTGMFER